MLNLGKLARLARISPLRNSRLYHRFRFERRKKECDKVIATFMGNDVSVERKKQIIRNMRHAMVEYHWDFDEYFMFNYEGVTHEERQKFVPDYDRSVFCDKVNDLQKADIFHNKWKTYKAFKEFFKRDAILVNGLSEADSLDVNDFIKKHQSFIMKPLLGLQGKGIRIVRGKDIKEAKEKLKEILLEHDTAYIVEELIKQVDEIAELHPESVNTVRITTINYGNSIEIIHPFMKTGQGNAFVDNGGSGGIISAINPDNGEVIAAIDERMNEYTEHPDSHSPLVGFCVPKWDEALDTAKELAKVIPDVKYVGWDLALTEKGWVVVEGNDRGGFIGFQLPIHRGFRDELNEIYKKLK